MITGYKVIKPFDVLSEGDVLKLDGDMLVFENELAYNTNGFYSLIRVAVTMDKAEEYTKSGLLEPISDTKDIEVDNSATKIENALKLIKQLKNTYTQRKNNIEKKYNAGKVQSCVKVEHDTVYFNMMKLLNKIEETLNE